MKLELKHLAPYLPYGLNIASKSIDKSEGILSIYKIEINENNDRGIENVLFGANQIPILRPLSGLKQHECYTSLSNNLRFNVDILGFPNYLDLKVNDYNVLLENHFDVFGLIEQGLAIDINTLNK